MRRPNSLREQIIGKAEAEAFVGSGRFPLLPQPVVHLAPPCEPTASNQLSTWHCTYLDVEAPHQPSWWARLFDQPVLPRDELPPVPTRSINDWEHLAKIVITPHKDEGVTLETSRQLLTSLPPLRQALCFEILGVGAQPEFDVDKAKALVAAHRPVSEAISGWSEPFTRLQIVAHRGDARGLHALVQSLLPSSSVTMEADLESADIDPGFAIVHNDAPVITLALAQPYFFLLERLKRLDADPLQSVFTALDGLDRRQWAIVQLLIEPTNAPWETALRSAIENPYRRERGAFLFEDVSDRLLADKFGEPLFAVVARMAASSAAVLRRLLGWAHSFKSGQQALVPNQIQSESMNVAQPRFGSHPLLSRAATPTDSFDSNSHFAAY